MAPLTVRISISFGAGICFAAIAGSTQTRNNSTRRIDRMEPDGRNWQMAGILDRDPDRVKRLES
jgi:hypothetical protein